ncbi:MAG: hypothetical protein AAF638_00540 [Pseudomonadota bacterium]
MTDLRGGTPDGTDVLIDMEFAQFADETVDLLLLLATFDQDFDPTPGDDLYLQQPNGNHFVVNGKTGAFSDGIGRGTDTVVAFDDFTGDGIADALFERFDGNFYIHDQTTEAVLGLGRGTETFVGTLDVDGDGIAEILFQRAMETTTRWILDRPSSPAMAAPPRLCSVSVTSTATAAKISCSSAAMALMCGWMAPPARLRVSRVTPATSSSA